MAVINSVAAVVTAYRDGADMVLALKERRWARGMAQLYHREQQLLEDLEMALAGGSDMVQSQYERDSRLLGEAFDSGDQLARQSLNDIVIDLQKRLMSRLKIAWLQDTHVDLYPLLGVAQDVQDRTIMCMMQLHHRLLAQLPLPIIERPRFKPRARRAASPAAQCDGPDAHQGAPQGFIDPSIPYPPDSHLFGNHVEITGPSWRQQQQQQQHQHPHPHHHHQHQYVAELDTTPPRPIPSSAPRGPMAMTAPRIHQVPSMTSGYIPIEYRDGDLSLEAGREQPWQEPPNMKDFPPPEHRFADSPTLSPARISSIGSLSSIGSHEYDDPEYNPWSLYGTDSPTSSYTSSASPIKSPYAPSLVPNALAPRRQDTDRSEISLREGLSLGESLHKMSLGPQNRNDSFGSSGIPSSRPPWRDDEGSVYSQPERLQSRSPDSQSCLSYYQNASPTDTTRFEFFPSPPTPQLEQQRSQRRRPQRSQPQSPRPKASYTWLPPKSPVREMVRPRAIPSPPLDVLPRAPPTIPLPRPPTRDAANPPTREPVSTPPRELVIPPNVVAATWETPRYAPFPTAEPTPIPPPRAPERDSRTSARPPTLMTTSSLAGSMVIPSPPTTGSNAHNSYNLANRRVSTVSSSNSSSTGNGRVPPLPTPAVRTIPSAAPPGNVKACLPNEKNKFAGFCKGAWRGQIGDTKKAYEERSRPAAISTNKILNYYKCRKCNFEGRAKANPAGKGSLPDDKLYGSNGILYRWEFLFKSHIEAKGALGNPLDAHYGCMFCCATGRGTPVFVGVASLMNHLQEHRETLPQGEIVYRMNAVVGRSPATDEDFDIALPSLVL